MATESVGGITVELMVNSKGAVDGMKAVAIASGVADDKVDKLVKTSLPQLQSGLQKTSQASGQAKQTLLSMTQVIQDAPYGIRGVANNIEFLTQSFTGLIASSGGTGNALKAVLASFTGPMGILFVVSAASSLLTVLADSFRSAGSNADGATDSMRDLNAQLTQLKFDIGITDDIQHLDELGKAMRDAKKESEALGKSKITGLPILDTEEQKQAYIRYLTAQKTFQNELKRIQKAIKKDNEDDDKQREKEEKQRLENTKERVAEIYRWYAGSNDAILEQLGNLILVAKTQEEIQYLQEQINKTFKEFKKEFEGIPEVVGDKWGEITKAGIKAEERRLQFLLDGMDEETAAKEKHDRELEKLINDGVITEAEAERSKTIFREEQEKRRAEASAEALVQSMEILSQMFPQMKAFAVAEAIANTYLAATKALASAPPPFNYVLMAATIGAGLAQVEKITSAQPSYNRGGFTGEGGRYEPAGVVHRGEIVFEKPLVDKHKDALLGLRSTLQRQSSLPGYAGGGLVGSSVPIMSNDGVIAELRMLRKEVRSLELQTNITMQTVSGLAFLKKELPKYQQYEKAKRL